MQPCTAVLGALAAYCLFDRCCCGTSGSRRAHKGKLLPPPPVGTGREEGGSADPRPARPLRIPPGPFPGCAIARLGCSARGKRAGPAGDSPALGEGYCDASEQGEEAAARYRAGACGPRGCSASRGVSSRSLRRGEPRLPCPTSTHTERGAAARLAAVRSLVIAAFGRRFPHLPTPKRARCGSVGQLGSSQRCPRGPRPAFTHRGLSAAALGERGGRAGPGQCRSSCQTGSLSACRGPCARPGLCSPSPWSSGQQRVPESAVAPVGCFHDRFLCFINRGCTECKLAWFIKQPPCPGHGCNPLPAACPRVCRGSPGADRFPARPGGPGLLGPRVASARRLLALASASAAATGNQSRSLAAVAGPTVRACRALSGGGAEQGSSCRRQLVVRSPCPRRPSHSCSLVLARAAGTGPRHLAALSNTQASARRD